MIFSKGKEVDHTVCKGKDTLFVSGWQPQRRNFSKSFESEN